MSREELVGAYLNGRISRRVFVRGLVATGVSLGAAISYSQMATKQAHASGHHHGSFYEPHFYEPCHITGGGHITTSSGDKANFGGNAETGPPAKGQQQYQDKGPATPVKVHSLDVRSVLCRVGGESATISGRAKVNGTLTADYRIDVTDGGKKGTDTYRIRLSNGFVYDSGARPVEGGNITIH